MSTHRRWAICAPPRALFSTGLDALSVERQWVFWAFASLMACMARPRYAVGGAGRTGTHGQVLLGAIAGPPRAVLVLDPSPQRRPNPQAASVASEQASGKSSACRRTPVSCAAYPMPGIARGNRSPFASIRAAGEPKAALASHAFPRFAGEGVVRERRLEFSDSVDAAGMGPSPAPYLPERNERTPCERRPRRFGPARPSGGGLMRAACVAEECYLVDPASSHMLVSKIKPCMCKYEQIRSRKPLMAH
ncbi:hypothetical protein H5410_064026 [Solanum commersonii]|uniref:Uncharacterized protein n=1 Tax=Solanum commersonii TaxID=4109 RepID=A0A9J5W1F8_SOLCO|nr:hypothetical protein H5410_064026 [Solanum commersonii]